MREINIKELKSIADELIEIQKSVGNVVDDISDISINDDSDDNDYISIINRLSISEKNIRMIALAILSIVKNINSSEQSAMRIMDFDFANDKKHKNLQVNDLSAIKEIMEPFNFI